MYWLIFEALLAGGILVFIVWWTMFSGRRKPDAPLPESVPEPPADRSTDPGDEARKP